MFHQERFPSFHSRTSFLKALQDRPITDDDRANRLTLWRDSIVPHLERDLGKGIVENMRSKKSELRKLSYLPTRLSKLEGIEKFFASAPTGKILIPSQFKSSAKSRGKIFYLIPRNLVLYYGPYYYLGILDYRTERLHGLQSALKFAGANVIIRPSNHINHVSIWYLEKEIFTCKLTDLHYGGDGELDRLCYEAAVAFSTLSKRAMLHIRHRYPFDKQKANQLIRKCPCHQDYQANVFMDDDEFATEEEEDQDEEDDDESFYYIDPYAKKQKKAASRLNAAEEDEEDEPKGDEPLDDELDEYTSHGIKRVNRVQVIRSGRLRHKDPPPNTSEDSTKRGSRKSINRATLIQKPKTSDIAEEELRHDLIESSKAIISKYTPQLHIKSGSFSTNTTATDDLQT